MAQTYSSNDPTRTQWPPVTPQPPASTPPGPAAPPPTSPAPDNNTPPRRRRRSLFWPGFTLGFLFLAALSCGILSAALGFNRVTLAEIQGSGIGWTPGPVTPSPAAPEIAAADAQQPASGVSTRFAAGQTVRNLTNSRVNIRSTPGYQSKSTADVIGVMAPGQTIVLTGDSVRADNLIWWGVQTTAGGQAVEGWVAEATASGVQILGPVQ